MLVNELLKYLSQSDIRKSRVVERMSLGMTRSLKRHDAIRVTCMQSRSRFLSMEIISFQWLRSEQGWYKFRHGLHVRDERGEQIRRIIKELNVVIFCPVRQTWVQAHWLWIFVRYRLRIGSSFVDKRPQIGDAWGRLLLMQFVAEPAKMWRLVELKRVK